ncbi:transcription initiation factor IIA subunit 2-like isoform X2 [Triticum dicoccoides]|uniref:transcription initiation factor IIA subunit 2-like isoform X2 n=1 Tax=Triticum dicoccoides TaxID=85692 RepID=UPI001890795E|nr:transcription initiation factor IIA subunit 2-like isoform X2 [Triticum dicoccoides]
MAEAIDLYRHSAIGVALIETLNEMVASGALSPELAMAVIMQFDKGGNLRTYRFCDSIWTLNLRNTTFMNEEIETVLPKVKIVAYDMRLIEEPVVPITCQQCQ